MNYGSFSVQILVASLTTLGIYRIWTLIIALHVNCRGWDRERDIAKVGDPHQWKLVELGGTQLIRVELSPVELIFPVPLLLFWSRLLFLLCPVHGTLHQWTSLSSSPPPLGSLWSSLYVYSKHRVPNHVTSDHGIDSQAIPPNVLQLSPVWLVHSPSSHRILV